MSHHHHSHAPDNLSFDEKMIKLLSHWVKHNIDHAQTYREWSKRAKASGRSDVGEILEKAAQETLLLNRIFENAQHLLTSETSGESPDS